MEIKRNLRQQPPRKSKSKQPIQTFSETPTSCKVCGHNTSDLTSNGYCQECEIENMSILSDDSIGKFWTPHVEDNYKNKNKQICACKSDENCGTSVENCLFCDSQFMCNCTLLDHIVDEHATSSTRNGKLVCTLCDKEFNKRSHLRRHCNSMHMNKNYVKNREPCVVCFKNLGHNDIKKHYSRIHSVEISNQCGKCGKIIYGKKNFKYHFDAHTKKMYKCNYDKCAKVFKWKKSFDIHIQVYHSSHPVSHVCDTCGKSFKHRILFKRHLETHNDKLKCDMCDKVYKRDNLTRHKKIVHFKTRKPYRSNTVYKCSYCNEERSSKVALTRHMKVHGVHVINKYSCSFCDRSFVSNERLQEHENTHTGNKPHKCTECNKSFSQVTAFLRHKLIHTGEQPFKCDICDRRFNQKDSLKRHQVVHTGEKPYACGICGQRFTQKPCMMAHERTKHEKVVIAGDGKKSRKNKNVQELESEEVSV